MTAAKKEQNPQYGLSLVQKIIYGVGLLALSTLVIPLSPLFTGTGGTVLFILFGILLGVFTWFISASWAFKLEMTASEIRLRDGQRQTNVPMDKVGMILRNGKPPLPTIWLVLRGSDQGRPIPTKGVDPETRAQLEAYQKRNPGKTITYVAIPGGYLRSINTFVADLKKRIPPLTVDDRLGGK